MHSPASGLEAVRWLEQRRAAGTPPPLPAGVHSLPLSAIETCEAAFQHRAAWEMRSADHSRRLAVFIEKGIMLDPVAIWWCGDAWICVDGHHRLKAYALAKHGAPIPVEVIGGTAAQMATAALQGNRKLSMPLTDDERYQAAWRAVVMNEDGPVTKASLALAAGVSTSHVGNMRRVRRVLLDREPGRDLTLIAWIRAMTEEKRGPLKENRGGAQQKRTLEQDAALMLPLLAKALGQGPLSPHKRAAAARAIILHDPGLADELVKAGGYTREADPDEDPKDPRYTQRRFSGLAPGEEF